MAMSRQRRDLSAGFELRRGLTTRSASLARRVFCLFIGCLFVSCGYSGAVDTPSRPEVVFSDQPRRPAMPRILAVASLSSHTHDAWRTLREELRPSFDVVTSPLTPELRIPELAKQIEQLKPSCIVLLGNEPMTLYLQYQQQVSGPYPPAVVIMASFFEAQRPVFKNTTGIAYEVPAITTFVNLRRFLQYPVSRVGVIHRPGFAPYIERQRALARVEEVELVPLVVRDRPTPSELRRALRTLILRRKVDAIWTLNDNVLVTPDLIAQGWLPVLHDNPVAVVVGAGSLVDRRLHFGSFGMLPDHGALGEQAADMIYRLSENAWSASTMPVELPLSVETVVDLGWARRHLHFREEALDSIDRVVE